MGWSDQGESESDRIPSARCRRSGKVRAMRRREGLSHPLTSASVRVFAALAVLAALLWPADARAQAGAPVLSDTLAAPPADSADGDRVRLRPVFNPLSVYSSTRGFGVQGGVVARNVAHPGSRILLGGYVAQRIVRGVAFIHTADPYRAPSYGGLYLRAQRSRVEPYYGVGPFTSPDNELDVDLQTFEAEARLGKYLYRRALIVQPVVRLRMDEALGYDEDDRGALDALTPADTLAIDRGVRRLGLVYGVSAGLDLRDDPENPTRGAFYQLGLRRYDAVDGTGLGWNRAQGSALFYLPGLSDGHVLFFGGVLRLTRPDPGDRLPYYHLDELSDDLLPGYKSGRFYGRDLLHLGGGYRLPLFTIRGIQVEGFGAAFVASVYDDVFRDFRPRVTFERDVVDEDDGVPLRPGVAIGGGVRRGSFGIGGVLGLSPEGPRLSTIRLLYDLRSPRPIIR